MDDDREVLAYDEADFRDVNVRFARRALRVAARRSGHAVDLGTGPAEIPIYFCRMAPGWRVTAVDASASMLKAARRNVCASGLAGRIFLRRADAKDLRGMEKMGKRFDLVFSNAVLHHLSDPLPFWLEVRRLVKPSGSVMVQDLLRPATRAQARRLVSLHAKGESCLLRDLFYQSFLAAYTGSEIREQLRRAGIRGLRVRTTGDHHLTICGRIRPS